VNWFKIGLKQPDMQLAGIIVRRPTGGATGNVEIGEKETVVAAVERCVRTIRR